MRYPVRRRTRRLLVVLAAMLAVCGASSTTLAASGEPRLPLRALADIAVEPAGRGFAGQTPRMDYESIDPRRHVLFVAYLGADEVVAVDIAKNAVVGHITGLRAVHGVLAIPSLHRVYASATGTDEVATIDEGHLKVVAREPGGEYPDGIAYDARDNEIFVSDESGGAVTVIDTTAGTRRRTIDVGGEAGNTQFDPRSRRVFTDVQARNDIAEIDPVSERVVGRHLLAGCEHDHGLALDSERRLAFVACDENARLLVMDLDDWKELATFEIGDEPDVLALDPGLGRLYVASESGVVSVFQEHGKVVKPLASAFLADEAHTVAVDPTTHRVYFALENVDGKAVIRVMTP
ncbi:MAG TPA: YncE family protein [Candidatus Eremiobacteraceae bacterium]|nr:YncE family protein [Candidatus Eremiobacteraceae bacterium]